MSNTRQSTSILRNSYNSRGMITHGFNAGCKNLIIEEDGTLWASITTSTNDMLLMRSTDDGFSWEEVNDDRFAGLNTRGQNLTINGPVQHLVVMPEYDRIAMFHANYTSTPDYEVLYSTAKLSDDLTTNSNWTDYQPVQLDVNEVNEGLHTVVHNAHHAFIIYIDSASDLACARWRANAANTISSPAKLTGTFSAPFDAVATDSGIVHVIAIEADKLSYFRYNHSTLTWNASGITIDSFATGKSIVEPSLSIDSYGTLMAVWGETNVAGTDIDLRYSISKDGGTTWATVDVTKTTGLGAYFDSIKGTPAIRCDSVGGQGGGFLMTYTFDNASSVPKAYVRELSTTDGITYTLQTEQLAAPVGASVVVAGAKFFKPPGTALLSIEDKSLVRMAFQIAEGNSTTQGDTTPVHFDSEILKHSAYPTDLATEQGSYTLDTAAAGELLVNVEVVAQTANNIDFYAKGMTGCKTELYEAGFAKLATSTTILKFEPKENSEMSDRSSYDDPVQYCASVVWQPLSYGFPIPDLGSTQQTDFVEKDVRKVFLAPNFHLSRTFLLNEGNFLKRTVWLALFDGNEYELSQVVPHFLKNQICYYEANAYVVGPSRNPFSRTVLPSET